MHYHLEVIMPPTETVEQDLAEILAPLKGWMFDHYKIGGRFSEPDKPDVCLLSKINPIRDCTKAAGTTPLVGDTYFVIPYAVMVAVDCHAKYLIQYKEWNGVQLNRTMWDGLISSALSEYEDELQRCETNYAEHLRPKDAWISVTVDYHR